jgi:monovalent cation/hydrogen antiporter
MEQGAGLMARRNTARLRLEREAVQAARGAVLECARTVDGEVLQSIIEEFDFEEGRLDRALGDPHQPG